VMNIPPDAVVSAPMRDAERCQMASATASGDSSVRVTAVKKWPAPPRCFSSEKAAIALKTFATGLSAIRQDAIAHSSMNRSTPIADRSLAKLMISPGLDADARSMRDVMVDHTELVG